MYKIGLSKFLVVSRNVGAVICRTTTQGPEWNDRHFAHDIRNHMVYDSRRDDDMIKDTVIAVLLALFHAQILKKIKESRSH